MGRIWIGGKRLKSDGHSTGDTADLRAGWTPFTFEFVEHGGSAIVRLSWSGPGLAGQPIPRESLRTLVWKAGARAGTPASKTDLAAGLVAHWKLDETAGTKAADSSGRGNDGTLANMAGTEWTTGRAGGALHLDGTNDHVVCGTRIDLAGKSFSLCAWARRSSALPSISALT